MKNILDKIFRELEIIKQNQKSKSLDGYISEHDARIRFKRGKTWFWNTRQNGLPFTKLGGEVYYLESDLVNLLEKNHSNKK